MSSGSRLFPLTQEQHPAVDPKEVVWLSASAGTGKTQVLSARVLRLLLQDGVSPSQILCLTFTKAGAAEMAERINGVLARWVRAKPEALAADLKAIGADFTPAAQARARRLFTEVLDCAGGGLRIDTIHAFSQWLLAAFPLEAGLTPGAKAMEDRERDLLLREVLADLLLQAEAQDDVATLRAIEDLSVRLGPDAVEAWLLRCAKALDALRGWQVPMLPRVKQLIGLPSDASSDNLTALCSNEKFDVDALGLCLSAYRQWTAKTGQDGAAVIADWLAASPAQRFEALPALHKILFNKDDTVSNLRSLPKFEEHFEQAAAAVLASSLAVREFQTLLNLAEWLAPALELGRKFALLWDAAKARAGLIDFDDQIRLAAGLLGRSELAEWIRYKLDRRFDHILVDEAQDTNAAQWEIIEALTGDFFSGLGQHGDKLRTLFVVGDYKQAIFRFQGTSPENFAHAKARVRREMARLAEGAAALRGEQRVRDLRDLGLGQSFRTSRQVLEFVDLAIADIGTVSLGLTEQEEVIHKGEDRPGQVVLWQVVGASQELDDEAAVDSADEGGETWLAPTDRQLADKIARQVAVWLREGFPLVKGETPGTARRATAGDVMVLVRKRKALAGLIVARLHAAGVPVAGVDRLRLAAPLGVRDLMAALRFAAQPLDDLNLACLLTSPLIGWSQEDLLEFGYRPKGLRLWRHLLDQRDSGPIAAALALLLDLLRQADFEPPQALLHWVLTGPWQGRRKLAARLGSEVNDPLDELLNAAGAFAATEAPSLHMFLRWFDAGDGELKREAGKSADEVRVMTVHGSKGLQAPIVILADAADNPNGPGRGRGLTLPDPTATPGEAVRLLPVPPLPRSEMAGPLAEADAATRIAEMQEHWRLLYVAMTRAEEALFIAGSLSPREKEPAPDSWYARLLGLFTADEPEQDFIWGRRWVHGNAPAILPPGASAVPGELALLPPWLERPVAAEPRPPRPLAPSSLGQDLSADPPFTGTGDSAAARRGVLMHRLLERLPDVSLADRRAAALAWLGRSGSEFTAPAREEMVASALAVLAHKDWAEIFAPGSLAEVPIAATVNGHVIAGTIDRLLIGDALIRVVDFKSARQVPANLDAVPVAILRQMAAYASALQVTYPGRKIEAALLYTQAPVLIELPAELLAAHKPGLDLTQ
ncbi:MAG: double-strand break repair helicase AddA [Novosphingobium sp.]